ncbi:pectate lyase family protein [Geofilum sp. OHC36d9]|uniref:pectate lyase family protein n=1 Tax=Geofilum sp. OHC36d9 TaxID=3458413 RepID=UPI004033ADE1
MKKFQLLILMMVITMSAWAQVPAFPGAEGHGRYVTGGRGGAVVKVTSLNDDIYEVGTLRWALNQPSPKTIVFEVSGTIFLNSALKINKGNVTIAGQSAPGYGICIAEFPVTVNADNVIVRFLRFRMGDDNVANADGADAFGGRDYGNVIIDHCSVSWSTDECASFYGMTNFTMQWCLIAESLRLSQHSKGAHGYGGIWGGNEASFHHNLMAHHDSRTPRFGPAVSTQGNDFVDYRNNVIYNWSGNGCYGGEAMNINLVANYYKPGPATPTGTKRGRLLAFDKKTGLPESDGFYPINDVWGTLYIEGNKIDHSTSSGSDVTVCENATADNWSYGVYNQIHSKYNVTMAEKEAMKRTTSLDAGEVTTHDPDQAYDFVLQFVGASLKRDALDKRIVEETRNGTAAFKGASTDKWGIIDSPYDLMPETAGEDWSPWPEFSSAIAEPDSDNDGMPDSWELQQGLNPDVVDHNLYTLSSDYTNLEVYLNSLVDHVMVSEVDDVSTGIDAVDYNDFHVTPNPVGESAIVYCASPLRMLRIYNEAGNLCLQVDMGGQLSAVVDVSGLTSGFYIFSVETVMGKMFNYKVMKL